MYGLIDTRTKKLVTELSIPVIRFTKAGIVGIKTKFEQPVEVKLTVKDASTGAVLYNK